MSHILLLFLSFVVMLCCTSSLEAQTPIVLKKGFGAVYGVSMAADGQRIFSVGGDNVIRIWNLKQKSEMVHFSTAAVTQRIAVSPDGRHFLSGGASGGVALHDTKTGKAIYRYTGFAAGMAFSSDGKRFYFAHRSGSVRACKVADGSVALNFRIPAPWDVAFSASGDHAVSSRLSRSDHTARIWDMATGKEVWQLKGHSARVTCVAWSPVAPHVLSGSADGTARLWDASSGKQLQTFRIGKEIFDVQFSPDGKRALLGSGIIFITKVRKPAGHVRLDLRQANSVRDFFACA